MDTLHVVELQEKHAELERMIFADAKGASLSVLTAPSVTHLLTDTKRTLHKYKL